jgi:hypothetical protein
MNATVLLLLSAALGPNQIAATAPASSSVIPGAAGAALADITELAGLEPGTHAVGFRARRALDPSRRWPSSNDPEGGRGRPLHLGLWYPAETAPGEPLSLGDYVVADWTGSDHADEWRQGREAALRAARPRFEEGLETPLREDQWAAVLATRGRARLSAPPLAGRFPLVFFETGLNGRSDFYVHLAELLASHSYAVASLASFGRTEGRPLAFDLAGVSEQVEDMELALRLLADEPGLDFSQTALAAWSVGGVSQAILRAKRPEAFRAAISLDSGTGFAYGAKLLAEAGVLEETRWPVPFLELVAGREGRFQVPRDRTFYEKHGQAPALRVELRDLTHGDFVVPYGIARLAALGPEGREGLREGTRAAVSYLLSFLDTHVRGRSAPPASLSVTSSTPEHPGAVVRDRRGPWPRP